MEIQMKLFTKAPQARTMADVVKDATADATAIVTAQLAIIAEQQLIAEKALEATQVASTERDTANTFISNFQALLVKGAEPDVKPVSVK